MCLDYRPIFKVVPKGSDEGWETRRGREESRVMRRTKGLLSQMGEVAGGVAAVGRSVEGTARSSWTRELGVHSGGWSHPGCQLLSPLKLQIECPPAL